MVSLAICKQINKGHPCNFLESIVIPWGKKTAKIKVCKFFSHEGYRPRDLSRCPCDIPVHPVSDEINEKLNNFDYKWPIIGKGVED